MNFISTRGSEKVTGARAIVQGLASDGGLFVPEVFPCLSREEIEGMSELTYSERTALVLSKFLDQFDMEFLKSACAKAYSTFEGDDPAPIVRIDEGVYILELFHGPTCAFKDMALTLLPYLMKKSCEIEGIKENILILTATSGDTGKAALEGFKNVEGTKVAVFYPDEGVSKMQRIQMCTQGGNNVFVAGVKGNFDDCQRSVKNMFASEDLKKRIAEKGMRLSSANSINLGRLLPQVSYYISSYVDMMTSEQIQFGDKVDFIVPTGNFGDILAGWYAKKMGVPVGKLICASNRNKVLTDFFETGVYDTHRPFYRTTSPSMDILVSSNLERLLFEVSGRNSDLTATRMKQLNEKGVYEITKAELDSLLEDFGAEYASEDDTVEAMYETFEEYGYPMDTHTGVALHAWRTISEKTAEADKRPIVILSTASPYKFPQDVLYALTGNDVKDSFKGIKRINLLTAMKPPKSLMDLRYKPMRFKMTLPVNLDELSDEIVAFAGGKITPDPSSSKK